MIDDERDRWGAICEKLARRAADEARKSNPPFDDVWDSWCYEILKGRIGRNEYYFPSANGGLVFISLHGFSYERPEEAAWRRASTRMKRQADLWKSLNDAYANPWGRWCNARGLASR